MENPGFVPDSGENGDPFSSGGSGSAEPIVARTQGYGSTDMGSGKFISSAAPLDKLYINGNSNGHTKEFAKDPGQGQVDPTGGGGDGTVRMKRQIGLFGGIAMIVGTMVGSGIFISPTGVFTRSGESVALSLIVWIGCGVLATLTAITYIELGTVVPRSGGEHAYFMAAFKPLHKFWGEIPAYQFAWMTATLAKPSSLAILSLSFGQYTILPIINGLDICKDWTDLVEYETAHKLLAVLCVSTVTFVNIMSASISARVQIVFTVAKLVAAGIVIIVGIYNLSTGRMGSLPTDGFDASSAGYGSIALAFYSGLWSYDGWNNLNFLTEELINPNRNLPLAILIGIPLATVLYTFMNVSYFTVLTKAEFVAVDAVGIEFGDQMLGGASFLIPVLVALSVFGTANGSQYTAGRISYVAARDGHLVDVLSYVHATRLTPVIAILFNTTLAIVFIAFNDVNKLIDSFSITAWIFYALSMVSFFVLRWKQPDAVRPIRVPWIIPAVALVISCYLVVAPIIDQPTIEHLYPLVFSIIGMMFYYPFVYKKYQLGFMGKVTRGIQLITYVAPSPYKAD